MGNKEGIIMEVICDLLGGYTVIAKAGIVSGVLVIISKYTISRERSLEKEKCCKLLKHYI